MINVSLYVNLVWIEGIIDNIGSVIRYGIYFIVVFVVFKTCVVMYKFV